MTNVPGKSQEDGFTDLLEALEAMMGGDEKLQVAVGGNPIYVDKFLAKTRAAIAKARKVSP